MGGEVLRRRLALLESTPLRVRDTIHAATALSQGFDHITTDADVDAVPGLRRVAPLDAGSI